ncbi:Fe-S cluster assembly protein SufD [Philodulcilactobacillus myokoensis]|uniref:Fe-S cluster assembly protein SufD n=1 Tax=Philodulcilactobacillus myokoensis TaxID=2929573 RepID=A0A9W6ESK0_9LACO|nr:SufD family Fe-S cluster assembly protein [Philodulcilactobacillus myokoensis]GLB46224.1 Fe-S cluster assembly protein SufD [Philodulcilactobacillus myokoensis]
MTILDQIERYSKANHEPQWLYEKRRVAWQIQKDLKQPRLNNVRPVDWNLNHEQIHWHHQVDFKNYASDEEQKQGIVKMDLLAAASQYSNLMQENLMEKGVMWNQYRFAAQHLACLQSGVFLFIPSNTVCSKPIDLSDILSHGDLEKHILVIVGANSEATLEFKDRATAKEHGHLMVEILLGDNAHVKYYDAAKSQNRKSHRMLYAYLAQNASLKTYVALLNYHDALYNSQINLDGDGSEAEIHIINLGTNVQHQSICTHIINRGSNTRGLIKERGVVDGHARTHCYTNGEIVKGAKDTSSDQISRLLTLSKQSRGEIDPILLIKDNDIVASHAASIGKLDPNQLYYLKSRGLDDQTADSILIRGFLEPLLTHFPDRKMRQSMVDLLEERLDER